MHKTFLKRQTFGCYHDANYNTNGKNQMSHRTVSIHKYN